MIKLISEKIIVKLGINELKVPTGTNICGFVNTAKGNELVITYDRSNKKKTEDIIIAVIEVGGKALQIDKGRNVVHVGTIASMDDRVYTAYGYQLAAQQELDV